MKSNDSKEILLLWEKYVEQMKNQSTNMGAIATLKFLKEQQLNNTVNLTLCFSKEKDSLHMWNCYANEGIAIGFDFDKLDSWRKSICMHNIIDPTIPNGAVAAVLRDVDYYTDEQIDDNVKAICKNAKYVTDGVASIFNNAPFIKSDFFKGEAETRIVITVDLKNDGFKSLDYVDENGRFISNLKFESISNNKFLNVLVCYVPFDLDMIKSITIGPNCSLEKSDIIQMFFANGLYTDGIDIIKSNGSYR